VDAVLDERVHLLGELLEMLVDARLAMLRRYGPSAISAS